MAAILNTIDKEQESIRVSDIRVNDPENAHWLVNPSQCKPGRIRVKIPNSPEYKEKMRIVKDNNLVTVCEATGVPTSGMPVQNPSR